MVPRLCIFKESILPIALLVIFSLSTTLSQCDHDHHSHDGQGDHSSWDTHGNHDQDHVHEKPSGVEVHIDGKSPHEAESPEEHSHHRHVKKLTVGSLIQPEELAEERELLEHGFYGEHEEEPLELIHGLTPSGLWLRAMGSSLIVSLASLICLSLLPFILDKGGMPSRSVVDGLAAFGVGAMLGDAFLHQLPHAFSGSGHGHSHSHDDHGHSSAPHKHDLSQISVGLSVLFGILLFFVVEKMVRSIESSSARNGHGSHGHSHGLRNGKTPVDTTGDKVEKEMATASKEEGTEERAKGSEKAEGHAEGGAKEGEADKVVDAVKVVREEKPLEGGEKEAEVEEEQEKEVGEEEKGKEIEEAEEEEKGEEEGEEGWESFPLLEENDSKVEEAVQKTGLRRRKHEREDKKAGKEISEPVLEKVEGEKEGEEKEAGKEKEASMREEPSLPIMGYLNLFSDGVHNFTDGMALGAAFLSHGPIGGWSRLLFMLAHELPQEVGDFGILVRSGFSVTSALAFNFLSALMAMAGTALALVVRKNQANSSLIEGFTAGGFIYICVAGVMPDMHLAGSDLKTTAKQLGCMMSGIAVAIVISLIE